MYTIIVVTEDRNALKLSTLELRPLLYMKVLWLTLKLIPCQIQNLLRTFIYVQPVTRP